MSDVLVVGDATVELMHEVDTLPEDLSKCRTRGARIRGAGHAANAAVAVNRLGGNAHFAGRVGEDPTGQLIIAGLQMERVSTALTRKIPGGKSPYTSLYIDRNGSKKRIDTRSQGLQVQPNLSLPYMDAVLADSTWRDGAVLAMQLARDRKVSGILYADAQVVTAALCSASHVVFSKRGLVEYLPQQNIRNGLRCIANEFGCWVCMRDSNHGVFWHHGQASGHVAAMPLKVIDTTGAGDIWCGAFALALSEGVAEFGAMRFANAAAALKCTRRGGRDSTPYRNETVRILSKSCTDA